MAARLQDRPSDLAVLAYPALELAQPGAVSGKAEDRLAGFAFAFVTDCRDVLMLADVDADGLHASASHAIIRPRGARFFRPTPADARSPVGAGAPPQDPDHRSRTEREGRTLAATVMPDSAVSVSPRGSAEVWTL